MNQPLTKTFYDKYNPARLTYDKSYMREAIGWLKGVAHVCPAYGQSAQELIRNLELGIVEQQPSKRWELIYQFDTVECQTAIEILLALQSDGFEFKVESNKLYVLKED